jgi:hypothetical protein
MGFERVRAEAQRDLFVSAEWSSPNLLVYSSVEPREHDGLMMLARHLAPEKWGYLRPTSTKVVAPSRQPFWTRVLTSELLILRGVEPRVTLAQSWPLESAEEISRWAELAVLDLLDLQDLLLGQNLQVLDEIIQQRPRRGVPGLDFPLTNGQPPS